MATIIFNRGDVFRFKNGHGVVLGGNQALLIQGQGGRTGWHIEKTSVPQDAVPDTLDDMPFEKRFALEAVQAAII